MKKVSGQEKHGSHILHVRASHVTTPEEKESETNKKRRRLASQHELFAVDLHRRQIQRRNDAMWQLRRMGANLSQIVKALVILRPDISAEEFTHNIIHYSASGKLTSIDVLYKAVAHAEAGLPMPWEVKQ